MTYAASIHLTLEVFPGKWVVSELNLHFIPDLQSAFYPQSAFYARSAVCGLR